MSTMSIRLPEKLRKELAQLSRRLNRPASELVRESVRRYIDAEQLRKVRETTRPRARAQGYLTDEDVFNDVS